MTIDGRGLAGVLAMSFAFGALHAFASLLTPLEHALQVDRGLVSLGYSLAIAALTLGVFAGARLTARLDDRWLCLGCGGGAAAGLAAAAAWPSLPAFLMGYGLAFGLSNGIAYGLFIARAGQSWPSRTGLAVGLATATYGLGAAVFGFVLGPVVHGQSVRAALLLMAGAVLFAGTAAALLFRPAPARADRALPAADGRSSGAAMVARLWLAYFLAACGGLMIIAHSEAILAWLGVPYGARSLSVSFNAGGNIAGSIMAGLLADRLRAKTALALPVALSLAALILLRATDSEPGLLAALALAGMAYGGLISVIPALLRHEVGPVRFRIVFPVVFSAWGLAGSLAPALAGFLYDRQNSYDMAILMASAMAAAALLTVLTTRFSERPTVPTAPA
jgi:MFS family permease